ncbi:PREDICTED: uncharacterized protein LOC109172310 [Ipomoea nil]|uniref:uncharacterized protein LOC109172310 n=1 Tax=Ipomoea nil TaxID=35883 RepID=UPI000901CB4A|nr:PREDICTED: uncharacterized protein LOC109172310 [Ipomoea nil]
MNDSQKMNFALVEIEKMLSVIGKSLRDFSKMAISNFESYSEYQIGDTESKYGGLVFVYGYGGTGKTFLWGTLSSALRSKGEIVLNVVSSGIASLLLPGVRTAHSRFFIPISVNEDSTCNISQGSPLAELIVQSKLTFGGKTVVFCGDFRQILPLISKGTRQDIVRASINSSYLWRSCKVFRLTKNLHLRSVQSEFEAKEIEEFAKWVANIGD